MKKYVKSIGTKSTEKKIEKLTSLTEAINNAITKIESSSVNFDHSHPHILDHFIADPLHILSPHLPRSHWPRPQFSLKLFKVSCSLSVKFSQLLSLSIIVLTVSLSYESQVVEVSA